MMYALLSNPIDLMTSITTPRPIHIFEGIHFADRDDNVDGADEGQ
jgi:hypothetical protein